MKILYLEGPERKSTAKFNIAKNLGNRNFKIPKYILGFHYMIKGMKILFQRGGRNVVFKKLKSFYLPYKKDFIWSTLFLIIMAGITVVYPVILQMTIDEVVLGGQYSWVPWISLGFIMMMAVKGLSTFIQHYLADMFGIKSVYSLRNALYEKLQRLSFSYYDNAKTGDLMSRLTADVEGFRFFVSFGFAEVLRFVIRVGASLCVMFYYSVSLTIGYHYGFTVY